jgi:hypothetical protein
MASEAGMSHIPNIKRSQPVAFHLWRSGGEVYILLGNLETGEFGDSRTPRIIDIRLSRKQLGLSDGEHALERVDISETPRIAASFHNHEWLAFQVILKPEQSGVWMVAAV